MSAVADIEHSVRQLIARNGPLPADAASFNYIDSGHVDSLGVMSLVAALEERFDIEISDEDILSDQFRTVGGLIAIVTSHAGAKAARAHG
jgi:acyl carrier protein